MRRLLVASQKGGVGKTTTSINLAAATALAGARVLLLDADPLSSISASLNLAEHAQRQPLRGAGVDLPGALTCNVVPGLDVLSPYDEGGCTDDELGRLLHVLATPTFQECYGCLIVDTPPFLGANPAQILLTCDEFILVMRAEPMAYRTLPAFLELVQRSRPQEPSIKMRGILLTLPDGENAGCRWERELRGRFGTRILPQVIPYDEEVPRALVFGQILSHSNRESPAAAQYHSLVESLTLASQARQAHASADPTSAMLVASASLKNAAAAATVRRSLEKPAPAVAPSLVPTPVPPPPVLSRPSAHNGALPPEPAFEPDFEAEVPTSVLHRLTPAAPVPAVRPPARPQPAAPQPVAPAAQPTPPAPPAPAGGFPIYMGLLWVVAAAVVGVTLRFLRLPEFMLPVLVGVGVAGVVVLVLRSALMAESAPPEKSSRTRGGRSVLARLSASLPEESSSRRSRVPTPGPDISDN